MAKVHTNNDAIFINKSCQAKLQEKTATIQCCEQVIEADEGYDGLKKVNVKPARLEVSVVVDATTEDVYVNPTEGFDGLKQVVVRAQPTNLGNAEALTQAQYDALTTIDPTKLYFIIDEEV